MDWRWTGVKAYEEHKLYDENVKLINVLRNSFNLPQDTAYCIESQCSLHVRNIEMCRDKCVKYNFTAFLATKDDETLPHSILEIKRQSLNY